MKTFKQSGEVLPVIAPYDVQRGSGVLIGQLFGLACATVNAGTSVDIMCKGEFVVDKVTTEAWAVGDKIYWNSSSKKFSNVGGGGLLVGLASESAVNPSLLGSLLLTQQPGLVDPVFNAVTGRVKYFNRASVPIIFSFPDFSPSILASLNAGATAVQLGNTVTITSTAHGCVGSTAKNGYRFYYPGSASIAAGWYGGFVWVDANTVRFTNPTAQTVGSESVNGGAAFTAQVTVCSATIEGGSIGANGKFRVNLLRDGDTSAQLKRVLAYMSATNIAYVALQTTPVIEQDITVRNIGSESVQRFSTVQDGATYPALILASKDTALDQDISIAASLAAAGCWLSIVSTEYEVTHRD